MLVANFIRRCGFNYLKLHNQPLKSFLKEPRSAVTSSKRLVSTNPVINTSSNSNNYSKCVGLFASGVLFYMLVQENYKNVSMRDLKASSSDESELEETLNLHLDEIYEKCAIEFLSNPQVSISFLNRMFLIKNLTKLVVNIFVRCTN